MLKFATRGTVTKEDGDTTCLRRKSPRRKHFYTWVATDYKQLELSEKLVLRGLNYHQAIIAGVNTISSEDITRYGEPPRQQQPRRTRVFKDEIAGLSGDEDAFISSSDAEDTSVEEREIVVLVHGFAGGSATWAQNWDYLSARYRLYAIDLPGFARSERRHTNAHTLDESMEVMTRYLHRWCARLNFGRKVTLVAHSFGCFVCSHFAMRYPEQVKVLILTEPWGINKADPSRIKKIPMTLRFLLRMFYATNPLSLLRGLGPAGPLAFKKSRPDFAANWSGFLDDPNIVYDYLYHCNARSPAMGETLFRVCCHHDVAAKVPLPAVLPQTLSRDIPVGILLGAESWITPGEALDMATAMRALGFVVQTDTVEKAGHQIFTDNVAEFNEKVSSMIEQLLVFTDARRETPIDNAQPFDVLNPLSSVEPLHLDEF